MIDTKNLNKLYTYHLPYHSEEFGQVVGCTEECHPKGEEYTGMTTPYHITWQASIYLRICTCT